MKHKIIINSVALAGILALGACTTARQTAFVDDVYQSGGKARSVSYRSPDYYADNQPVDDGQYADSVGNDADTVYDTVYNDVNSQAQNTNGGYYNDEYSDSEYANRINRFYYSSPGMSYYDPWFDPWYGYAPGFSFGIGWGGGWGWGSGFSLGWGSSFYSPYYAGGWGYGYPYYGRGFWGPYSYYSNVGFGWGGYYGGGYYGHNHYRFPQRTRTAYNSRSSRSGDSGRSPSGNYGGAAGYMGIGGRSSRTLNGNDISRSGTSGRVLRPGSPINSTDGISRGRVQRETVYITRDQNGRVLSTSRGPSDRTVRSGISSRNYGGDNRVSRPSSVNRPNSSSYSRPETVSRPSSESSRPSYSPPPQRSSGESSGGGRSYGGGGRSSGGGGGGGRSSRGR
ncbi:hypothetical protein SAMN05216436_1024 [bacterium A37T11]|nr:hypothetical protein SAMN05216436_1024 [bacterium A37T11]